MIKRKLYLQFFLIIFLLISFSICLAVPGSNLPSPKSIKNDEWYFLPAYSNYAPRGIPDFDQQQDNWKARQGIWRFIGGLWSFCGPTALANVFWWFDSKHENPNGYPGDGINIYPLVINYNAPGFPAPGPWVDDHNFNNVNDLNTSWNNGKGAKEFIEKLAWYCNTNFCQRPLIRGFAGTYSEYLEEGAKQWIEDAHLQDYYLVEAVWQPDFFMLNKKLHNNTGIILNLLFYNQKSLFFSTFLGHYVAIAGINQNGSIALSDPFQNRANPAPNPVEHNDANVVSYDLYHVNFTSPFPEKASWWIQNYFHIGMWTFGGIAHYALIISEIE